MGKDGKVFYVEGLGRIYVKFIVFTAMIEKPIHVDKHSKSLLSPQFAMIDGLLLLLLPKDFLLTGC